MTTDSRRIERLAPNLRQAGRLHDLVLPRLGLARWPGVMVFLVLGLLACDRDPLDEAPEPHRAKSTVLPAFELRDDTPDLLLTWIDAQGDFHVVGKLAEVPEGSREFVRVVDRAHNRGTGELLYVADLRQKRPNGTYVVKTTPRAQWDELGASKRKTRLEAVARTLAQRQQSDAGEASSATVSAVVYGAEWCGACHQAAKYLKSIGVTVVMKDIDKEPDARRELGTKLSRANKPRSSSIPVIDIKGELLVGFDPRAVDRAVRKAKSGQGG